MTKTTFDFHGNGTEYFKIWLVNLTLSILTLGIYSAWAKVRTKRYFYNNLSYQNHRFDYLASPLTILIGRIIAVIIFIIYSIFDNFPILSFVIFIIFIIASPWIICRSIRFNARVSQFSNVRFDFSGRYLGALKVFILLPLLIFLSLGILYPWVKKQQVSYIINRLHYGNLNFKNKLPLNKLYSIYGKLSLFVILGFIGFGGLFGLISLLNIKAESIFLLYLLTFYAFVISYLKANITNLIYNTTGVASHQLSANLKTIDLMRIYFVYGFLTIITFGLGYAWLKVKIMNYQATHTYLALNGGLDSVSDTINSESSALGEELSDVFDIGAV